jgi:hypothetical protein
MTYETGYQCAFCGEWNDTVADRSGGRQQTYVEDCQVCCRPNILEVMIDDADGSAYIRAERES